MNREHIALPDYEKKIGGALRLLRQKSKARQGVLAVSAGLTKSMLSSYETGKQVPSLRSILRLLEALGASLSDLEEAIYLLEQGEAEVEHAALGNSAPGTLLDALGLIRLSVGDVVVFEMAGRDTKPSGRRARVRA